MQDFGNTESQNVYLPFDLQVVQVEFLDGEVLLQDVEYPIDGFVWQFDMTRFQFREPSVVFQGTDDRH